MKQKRQVEIKFKIHLPKLDIFLWVFVKWAGDILKNIQKQVRLFKRFYMTNDNENDTENQKQII